MPKQYSQSHVDAMNWPIFSAVKPTPDAAPIAIDRPVCVVGARTLVGFPLASPYVSKGHALIVCEAGGVYLRDLMSLNKTFVNRRPVRESWLLDRDVVQFGTESFVCRSGFVQPSERKQTPAMELWLIASGGSSTQVIMLGQETFLIGSRSGCDLLLEADEIACAHAVIFVRDGRRYLRSLSPWQNTLVDGRFLRESELHGEEHVDIGKSRLEFHLVEPNVTLADESAAVEQYQDVGAEDTGIYTVDEAVEETKVASALNNELHADDIILPWDEPAEEPDAVGSFHGQ